jgi:hypothetical protein
MTNYFKVELEGNTYLRSSKSGEYKFATFYEIGIPTFTSRLELAGKVVYGNQPTAVVEVNQIDIAEFKAITKSNKAAEAIVVAEIKKQFLAKNPVLNFFYELPADYKINLGGGTTTTALGITRFLDKGYTYSDSRMVEMKAIIEKIQEERG